MRWNRSSMPSCVQPQSVQHSKSSNACIALPASSSCSRIGPTKVSGLGTVSSLEMNDFVGTAIVRILTNQKIPETHPERLCDVIWALRSVLYSGGTHMTSHN